MVKCITFLPPTVLLGKLADKAMTLELDDQRPEVYIVYPFSSRRHMITILYFSMTCMEVQKVGM